MQYFKKYLKYKNKYLKLKGGSTPSEPELKGIEAKLVNHLFLKNDKTYKIQDKTSTWDRYLFPNESNQIKQKELIDQTPEIKDGILVSCGTERTLNTLSYSQKFLGLVCIDVNENVKLYNDFNFLLIRLAENRDEYINIRKGNFVLPSIKERFGQLPSILQNYYLENFDSMHKKWSQSIKYLESDISVRGFNFDYLRDDETFNRIQDLIRNGMCVTLYQNTPILEKFESEGRIKKHFLFNGIGGIHYLRKLRGFQISLVDSSNIKEYARLNRSTIMNRDMKYLLPDDAEGTETFEIYTNENFKKYYIIPLEYYEPIEIPQEFKSYVL